jgi:hydrogenase small subunit
VIGRTTPPGGGLYAGLLDRGISRRAFLRFSAAMAAALALPASYAPRIAEAVEAAPRLPVIWLRGQDCGGNTMAFLRAANPTVSQMLLELLSVEYHESIMAPSGGDATQVLLDAAGAFPEGYLAVIEGAVPTADGGVSCLVGGRAFRDVAREVCQGALATIAVGSCASDGGAPAAGGGPTGAVAASDVVSGGRLIRLPGCPVNAETLTATIVHYLTFNEWPPTDGTGRPYFAYGSLIHNQCERRPHYEYGEFVLAWGDEGAQKGWCLYKMGCKGPETMAECPTTRYASGASWPVRAGHGCIGCHSAGFWDAMSPFYRRLPPPLMVAPQLNVDVYGQALVGGVIALTAVHGVASVVREHRSRGGHEAAAAEPAQAHAAESAQTTTAGPDGSPEAETEPGAEPSTAEAATEPAPVPEPAAGHGPAQADAVAEPEAGPEPGQPAAAVATEQPPETEPSAAGPEPEPPPRSGEHPGAPGDDR